MMYERIAMHMNNPAKNAKHTALTGIMKRLAYGRLTRALFKLPPAADSDPYLLVLLADQEIGDGRVDQAHHLIDAAYAAFDRKAKTSEPALSPAA
jgi:hypothetical protein